MPTTNKKTSHFALFPLLLVTPILIPHAQAHEFTKGVQLVHDEAIYSFPPTDHHAPGRPLFVRSSSGDVLGRESSSDTATKHSAELVAAPPLSRLIPLYLWPAVGLATGGNKVGTGRGEETTDGDQEGSSVPDEKKLERCRRRVGPMADLARYHTDVALFLTPLLISIFGAAGATLGMVSAQANGRLLKGRGRRRIGSIGSEVGDGPGSLLTIKAHFNKATVALLAVTLTAGVSAGVLLAGLVYCGVGTDDAENESCKVGFFVMYGVCAAAAAWGVLFELPRAVVGDVRRAWEMGK